MVARCFWSEGNGNDRKREQIGGMISMKQHERGVHEEKTRPTKETAATGVIFLGDGN